MNLKHRVKYEKNIKIYNIRRKTFIKINDKFLKTKHD